MKRPEIFNLSISDFCLPKNIEKIHQYFLDQIALYLSQPLLTADILKAQLLTIGVIFEDVISELFNNRSAVAQLQAHDQQWAPLWMIKRQFIQRQALKRYTPDQIDSALVVVYEQALKTFIGSPEVLDESRLSQHILQWLDQEELFHDILQKAHYYTAAKVYDPSCSSSCLFNIPGHCPTSPTMVKNAQNQWVSPVVVPRHFFSLTDSGLSACQAMDQSQYCLWCHQRNKDSCRTGIAAKKLTGCPLDQKISEMIFLKSHGLNIAALAMAMVDNPLIALTGHRICQDCSKSCIYQHQEPVDIPGIETQIFESVLNLPWGLEIYYLLSQWNPFNLQRPKALSPSNRSVLVVGAGPAGLNLAYHLLQEGHDVVMIEGLKVEPLASIIPQFSQPMTFIKDFFQDLDQRQPQGVGGVAEYGITPRWNKNYLTIVRLLLERRSRFSLFGGVYFDKDAHSVTAFKYVDHIALCTGIRQPHAIPLKRNNGQESGYVKGVKFANDFLMTLQGGGAFHEESVVNLTLELPAVVIGGGLTAIDTAVEALAYYPRQVLKLYQKYQKILQQQPTFLSTLSPAEQQLLQRWLNHAALLHHEQHQAQQQGRAVNFLPFLQQWGGVTIYYRRDLHESPSYHQCKMEIAQALQQGIIIEDEAQIINVMSDTDFQLQAIVLSTVQGIKEIPARTLLLATGMNHPEMMQDTEVIAEDSVTFSSENSSSQPSFLYQTMGQQSLTYFGDAHPKFRGSVVKAMASAKAGYPFINQLLQQQTYKKNAANFHERAKQLFTARVMKIKHLSDAYELTVRYPWGASHYKPGHFFRLHPLQYSSKSRYFFESLAVQVTNKHHHDLTFIIKKIGSSSTAYQALKPGALVALTGPSGKAIAIPLHQRFLIIVQEGVIAWYHPLLKAISAKNKVDFFYISSKNDAVAFLNSLKLSLFVMSSVDQLAQKIFEIVIPDHIMILGDSTFSSKIVKVFPSKFLTVPMIGVCCPPMQCTMKGICGQCVQTTTAGEVIFGCQNIYHPINKIDYSMVDARLQQNSVHEKITHAWWKLVENSC